MRVARVTVALILVGIAAATGAAAGTPPRCGTDSLRAWSGRSGVAAGTIYAEYGFVNVSSQACSLRGFPALRMFDGSGRRVATTVRHLRSPALGYTTPKLVLLRHCETAYFAVVYEDQTGFERDHCPASTQRVLTPPGAHQGLVLRGANARIAPYGGTVQHLHCGLVNVGAVTAKPLVG